MYMQEQSVNYFKHFTDIRSLANITTRSDRICVLNIFGEESLDVTAAGNVFAGSKVIFGTSSGRGGHNLVTRHGVIPVYKNVFVAMDYGHRFNCGVICLPPAEARDGVADLIRVNQELKKIIIVTKKISVLDARVIRTMCHLHGIDIFEVNKPCMAEPSNQDRIAGGLCDDSLVEPLRKGAGATLSNFGGLI
jgi:succinyl-CoA synthetase alpha subunit